jgi:hypothetical protein
VAVVTREMRVCSDCGEEKELEKNFSRQFVRKRNNYYYFKHCKVCEKIRKAKAAEFLPEIISNDEYFIKRIVKLKRAGLEDEQIKSMHGQDVFDRIKMILQRKVRENQHEKL